MLLKQHISTVCQTDFFHLRSIGQIRRYLTEDSCTTLVHSLVSTRIDYCNSLLVNLPACSLQKLQRVLNTAARIVSLRPKRDDISPVLTSLHWLPIEHRIHYKIILFVFRCLHNLAPSYLSKLLKFMPLNVKISDLQINTFWTTAYHQPNMVNVLFQCQDPFCGTVCPMISDCWMI